MKLLYVTDLHGSQWAYDQVLLTAQLGNTICIQPGQLAPLTFVTIDVASRFIERHEYSYQLSA